MSIKHIDEEINNKSELKSLEYFENPGIDYNKDHTPGRLGALISSIDLVLTGGFWDEAEIDLEDDKKPSEYLYEAKRKMEEAKFWVYKAYIEEWQKNHIY